jgi:hypothetical protein
LVNQRHGVIFSYNRLREEGYAEHDIPWWVNRRGEVVKAMLIPTVMVVGDADTHDVGGAMVLIRCGDVDSLIKKGTQVIIENSIQHSIPYNWLFPEV